MNQLDLQTYWYEFGLRFSGPKQSIHFGCTISHRPLPCSFPSTSLVQALAVSPLGTLLEAATAPVPIQRRLWTFQLISEAQHAFDDFLDQKPSLVSSYAEEVLVKPSLDNPGTRPPAADGSPEEKPVFSGLPFKAELLVFTSPKPPPSPLFLTHTHGATAFRQT